MSDKSTQVVLPLLNVVNKSSDRPDRSVTSAVFTAMTSLCSYETQRPRTTGISRSALSAMHSMTVRVAATILSW
ncbi:unnamed protein product [Microthlaspi erraticum]|uniref:Uncharacterized protein n=1 Tax=Microthlaspi erraticum TaxID=1685480 RepID=A0A6D2JF35_9BRAS|nr:unnamed protein product [Microthlaspi erraticum]CAA7057043.1 unnamed protein product [Microthlaspi erraticum]